MLSNSRFFIRTILFILVSAVTWIALTASAAIEFRESRKSTADPKLAQGLAAWEQVYSVLISPRCINCHTATNYPQQGDDRQRHFANVVRGGPEGKGVAALNCVGCHQEVNADSTRRARESELASRASVHALAGHNRSTIVERGSVPGRDRPVAKPQYGWTHAAET